ncbi:GAF domain-containing protein [Nonomuraea basaltis]|uniref:GAF domain-containing protein n=1 Tax=Nonomuraea basaltis TaxID=2495887 RepID=UPI00110C45C3|nr:GAF domain-containing protein [Nonomuraea basaltis]TMR90095.1 transcriptional regulator [Nonomuraea basaltis]
MDGHGTLRERRARLHRQWARWVAGDRADRQASPREEIVASWRRSIRWVPPERDCAPVDVAADDRWAGSPLHEPVRAVSDELRTIAEDGGFVAAVTDESGTILWTCGGRVMRRRAETVNFAPGGRWDEPAMGTNALSLALRHGRPASVFSAEHLVEALHGWVCYCAPIKAPDGRVLGVLDLSSTWDRSHPLAMPALTNLVTGIEQRLAKRLTPGRPGLYLRCLGAMELLRDGAPVRLRPRQVEILTLLALEGHAMSPERLRDELYGERHVTATTLKAEVSHLRRALRGAVSTRRYELTEPIACDAVEVLSLLAAGRGEQAVDVYGGPLLPSSDAPGIRRWREHIEVAVREAVLRSMRPEPALRYGELHPYDLQIHERALALLPAGDARCGVALARCRSALGD